MGILRRCFLIKDKERKVNNHKSCYNMKLVSRLLILTSVLLNICSCIEITRKEAQSPEFSFWLTDNMEYRNSPYTDYVWGCEESGKYCPNTVCCFQNTDGTFAIKNSSPSSLIGCFNKFTIKLIPESGTLENGMVFRIEDGNMEMTGRYTTNGNNIDCKATEGTLTIDEVEKGIVCGTFNFCEDELWSITEGKFIIYMFEE